MLATWPLKNKSLVKEEWGDKQYFQEIHREGQ